MGGSSLLNGCHELGKSLPTMHSHRDWPIILGHFKNLAKHLEDVGAKAESQLAHSVAVPNDPARGEDMRPTMKVPQLLGTKAPPEQEAEINEVIEEIGVSLLDEESPEM